MLRSCRGNSEFMEWGKWSQETDGDRSGCASGAGRVGSLGLGTGQQPGFAQSACMLPQSTEQPNLGSKQLVVGELEQQLLAWLDKRDMWVAP